MPDIADLLRQGSTQLWLFIPTAILLGALHGLEPGHSKTMMAAFIVAIRGTIGQAVLLGLSAAFSHTLLVWGVALAGLHFGSQWSSETTEPYFQLASSILIIGVALWMIVRTYREQKASQADEHHHGDETKRIDTGHEIAHLEVFETGVPPRFRLRFEHHGRAVMAYQAQYVTLATLRPDGMMQEFTFSQKDDYLESDQTIPEPHEFKATLHLAHGNHAHDFDVQFTEHHHEHTGLDVSTPGFQDAHERAHAADIKRRFTDRHVTTGQIVMFGLTGGLIPCPAAITVLLLCLQLKKVSLGAALVLCFSIGLALTMVLSGVLAAWGVKHAAARFQGFTHFMRRAPYISSSLIICIGLYVGIQAWIKLAHL